MDTETQTTAGRSFTDTEGRRWTLNITIADVRRVRDQLDIDLMELVEGGLLERIAGDPVLLVDLLYALCGDDAAALGDQAFGRSFDGDVIEQAQRAFVEAVIDFFPPAKRETLRRLMSKIEALEQKALNWMNTQIDNGKLDEALDQQLQTHGDSWTKPPASSASTPSG